ncbi:hypothetical protein [Candidatus Spongiihabitans sp.]
MRFSIVSPNSSLPGLFRAIQWNMPSGVAGLICGEAAPFDARMTARR